jgi:hypothetical protein
VTVTTGRLGDTMERLLPFLTIVTVVTIGFLWFVQPRLGAYLRVRSDATALEERARTLRQLTSRAPSSPRADMGRSQREFEARMSADDKVADVAAALAHAVLASAPTDELRSFTIETGDRAAAPAFDAAGDARRAPGSATADGADPRLALFPYAVTYTPLRVTFDSSFEAASRVLWQVRDFPTVVEVRSATLTRGLPLMRTELLVRVLQRGRTADVFRGVPADGALPAAPGPTAPRVAATAGEEGAAR